MDFSLIVPSYNEEGNIELFLREATRVFDGSGYSYEILVIDDGSTDATMTKLRTLRDEGGIESSAPIRVISFSRNFGKEAAMYAGLKEARGDAMGFIDSDLQQRPETSLEMLEILSRNPDIDCVAAVQARRHESAVLKFFKGAFYRMFNMVGDVELTANASDFRVFRRIVGEALLAMPERDRFSKGLFSWVGFNVHIIEYEAQERNAGTTSWSFRKLMGYAIGGMASFSVWPLRLILYVGILTSIAAAIYLIVVLFETIFIGVSVPGYPTLVCLILLFNGLLMASLGIIGEYLGRVFIEGKQRPIYLARERFDLNGDEGKDDEMKGAEQ